MSQQLQQIIDTAWDNRAELSPKAAPAEVRDAVAHAIEQLDKGQLRVAEKRDGEWVVNQWLKKAVLLSFRLEDNAPMPAGGYSQFYDKVPSKFANYTAEDFAAGGFRQQSGSGQISNWGEVGFRFEQIRQSLSRRPAFAPKPRSSARAARVA